MRSCTEYEEMIEAWLDGELGGDGLDELRVHAAECESCGASFAGAGRLKGDMRSLAECAERIAEPRRVIHRGIRYRAFWKIAAAILIAVTLAWSFRQLPVVKRDMQDRTPVAQAEKSRDVIQVADAGDVIVAHPSHEMAVKFESKRSDVKIVWLYSPIPEKERASPTSAPQS